MEDVGNAGRSAREAQRNGIGNPPAGSPIVVKRDPDLTSIVLPRAVLGGRLWLLYLFCAPFLLLPLVIEPNLAGLVLHVVGWILFLVALLASMSRQVVRVQGDRLEFELALFGRCLYVQPLQRRQLEKVVLRDVSREPVVPGERRYRAVYVESEAGDPICLGPSLDPASQQWLRDTLRSLK